MEERRGEQGSEEEKALRTGKRAGKGKAMNCVTINAHVMVDASREASAC